MAIADINLEYLTQKCAVNKYQFSAIITKASIGFMNQNPILSPYPDNTADKIKLDAKISGIYTRVNCFNWNMITYTALGNTASTSFPYVDNSCVLLRPLQLEREMLDLTGAFNEPDPNLPPNPGAKIPPPITYKTHFSDIYKNFYEVIGRTEIKHKAKDADGVEHPIERIFEIKTKSGGPDFPIYATIGEGALDWRYIIGRDSNLNFGNDNLFPRGYQNGDTTPRVEGTWPRDGWWCCPIDGTDDTARLRTAMTTLGNSRGRQWPWFIGTKEFFENSNVLSTKIHYIKARLCFQLQMAVRPTQPVTDYTYTYNHEVGSNFYSGKGLNWATLNSEGKPDIHYHINFQELMDEVNIDLKVYRLHLKEGSNLEYEFDWDNPLITINCPKNKFIDVDVADGVTTPHSPIAWNSKSHACNTWHLTATNPETDLDLEIFKGDRLLIIPVIRFPEKFQDANGWLRTTYTSYPGAAAQDFDKDTYASIIEDGNYKVIINYLLQDWKNSERNAGSFLSINNNGDSQKQYFTNKRNTYNSTLEAIDFAEQYNYDTYWPEPLGACRNVNNVHFPDHQYMSNMFNYLMSSFYFVTDTMVDEIIPPPPPPIITVDGSSIHEDIIYKCCNKES